jgi:hypothetical protein
MSTETTTKKMMSVCRFATLWVFDGYHEREGNNVVKIYEPLRTDAPKNARPSIQWGKYIDFYKPAHLQNKATGYYYDEKVLFIDLIDVSPVMLFIDAVWYERSGGKVEWFDKWECWCITWHCYKNTRMAAMMNGGMPEYKK